MGAFECEKWKESLVFFYNARILKIGSDLEIIEST